MRACIYCRLSFNPDGTALGIDVQDADCRRTADELGATVVDVITDDDRSASKADVIRPGFHRLLEGIIAGDWDLVIAYDQSRLVRQPGDLERIMQACAVAKVDLHLHRTGASDFATPEGKFTHRLFVGLDALESEKISVRTRRNMAERAQRGLPLSGAAGFGYEKDPKADNYRIVDGEADEIRAAAHRVLAGDPLAAIARDWNERKIPSRRPGQWSPSSVRRILLAPRTAGLRTHRGEVVGRAAWPPILDEVTYARLGRALTDPRRRTANSRSARLLTGIVECSACLNTLNHKVQRGHPKYYCRHCKARLVSAAALEEFVRGLVVPFIDSLSLTPAADSDTDAVLVELDDVRARKAALAARMAAGGLDPDEWEAARAVLVSRERQLSARLDAAQPDPLLAEWAGRGDALDEQWDAMDRGELRRLVRLTFRWLRIGPATPGLTRFDSDRVWFEYAG